MRLRNTSLHSAVKLSEDGKVPSEVQVLRVGKFAHPQYGKFEITTQVLAEMKANFDQRVRGIDISFDYAHLSDKEASGWPSKLELRENGTELWAVGVEWTQAAAKKLADREYRYFSPDFTFRWKDSESGKTFSNVLFGGGLTNRPFVKEMAAIVADESQGDKMTELETANKKIKELETTNLKLTEEKAAVEKQMADMPKPDKVAELEAQIAALQSQLAAAKSEQEASLAEKKKLEEAAKLAEKQGKFNVLLSEGKACKAQEKAFLDGNMEEFIKLAQPVNSKGSGTTAGAAEPSDEDEILKLAEAKMKENKNLEIGDAISIVKAEQRNK